MKAIIRNDHFFPIRVIDGDGNMFKMPPWSMREVKNGSSLCFINFITENTCTDFECIVQQGDDKLNFIIYNGGNRHLLVTNILIFIVVNILYSLQILPSSLFFLITIFLIGIGIYVANKYPSLLIKKNITYPKQEKIKFDAQKQAIKIQLVFALIFIILLIAISCVTSLKIYPICEFIKIIVMPLLVFGIILHVKRNIDAPYYYFNLLPCLAIIFMSIFYSLSM